MKVIGILNLDQQNRICISSLFGDAKPERVQISIDITRGVATIERASSENDSTSVDSKGRIVVPAWIRRSLPKGCKGFYVVIAKNGEKVLIPAVGNIAWAKA